MRFRSIYIILGSLCYILASLLADPDNGIIQNMPMGAGTAAFIIILLRSVLYVGMLHFSRKALADYIDLEKVYNKAMEAPEGAGKVMIGVAIQMVAIALVIQAATR